MGTTTEDIKNWSVRANRWPCKELPTDKIADFYEPMTFEWTAEQHRMHTAAKDYLKSSAQ
jgi:hypothetical protein